MEIPGWFYQLRTGFTLYVEPIIDSPYLHAQHLSGGLLFLTAERLAAEFAPVMTQ